MFESESVSWKIRTWSLTPVRCWSWILPPWYEVKLFWDVLVCTTSVHQNNGSKKITKKNIHCTSVVGALLLLVCGNRMNCWQGSVNSIQVQVVWSCSSTIWQQSVLRLHRPGKYIHCVQRRIIALNAFQLLLAAIKLLQYCCCNLRITYQTSQNKLLLCRKTLYIGDNLIL